MLNILCYVVPQVVGALSIVNQFVWLLSVWLQFFNLLINHSHDTYLFFNNKISSTLLSNWMHFLSFSVNQPPSASVGCAWYESAIALWTLIPAALRAVIRIQTRPNYHFLLLNSLHSTHLYTYLTFTILHPSWLFRLTFPAIHYLHLYEHLD